ncbi:hypothetical protein [Streptomyces luteolus]|uniref:Uncharacterized protein n=1 Tax=Streptomyces luteolus TaxID=3043615 RepID=A0ABT6T8K6_9ACTN|nr:hypothetical protein [Streptomyces sp. B-S-A12]MDI3424233.1 hypothetical protein [Streptomyces sp. B-S-A12]
MTPAIDERDRIRAAMDRILSGSSVNSNGALTVVALATEAGVPRNALTQRHQDLKNEFYEHVRARGEIPDSEKRLRARVVKLKEQHAEHLKEIEELKNANEILVRALHQAQMENRQLRQQAALQEPRIRALPTQPHPAPSLR